mmetsp:Transcript_51731/g.136770  ORF Transcript_51731/g.136770 Transcript_51731/m.136770 type:complete len:370 (+) Transcript_51731:46-1155(+)
MVRNATSQRWDPEEVAAVAAIRRRCRAEIAGAGQYADVIGDRKIVRFLRGHKGDVDKVTDLFKGWLKFRQDEGMDKIRENIVVGGMNAPERWPNGEVIQKHSRSVVAPQGMVDKFGAPLIMEYFDIDFDAMLSDLSPSVDEALKMVRTWWLYNLEFRALILEQLSEEREREAENKATNGTKTGVLVQLCIIRNLQGLSRKILSNPGRGASQEIMQLASANYPEMMRKCHIVNAPYIFDWAWSAIKAFIPAATIAKITVSGGSFMEALKQDMDMSVIPSSIGGEASLAENKGFPFDPELLKMHAVEETADAPTERVRRPAFLPEPLLVQGKPCVSDDELFFTPREALQPEPRSVLWMFASCASSQSRKMD